MGVKNEGEQVSVKKKLVLLMGGVKKGEDLNKGKALALVIWGEGTGSIFGKQRRQ